MKKLAKSDSTEVAENLHRLLQSTSAFQPHLRHDEPDWKQVVNALNLSPAASLELTSALKRVWILPFANVTAMTDLLLFQFTRLPDIRYRLAEKHTADGERLCALFDLLVSMSLQGFSPFPQNTTHLAQQVQKALEFPDRKRTHLLPLLELLIDSASGQPDTGLNNTNVADPEYIILCEHERREGLPEGAWKAPYKYAEFQERLRDNAGFKKDWQTIKARFDIKNFCDRDGIIRRTKLEEGNWRQPISSDLSRADQNFQVVYDFFCWKWFLYGMKGDEPLVQKLAYSMNPYGTMIFIPGYWSFDPKRDLNWDKILRLHRARGIGRQGPKLGAGRQHKSAQLKKLLAAEAAAKRMKLKGQSRYSFLKEKSGLTQQTDDSQVRRMLRDARKIES
jgi:hypothetical protein